MEGSFAGALRDLRTRCRISQLELARRAGTTQRYVSFIERGQSVRAARWSCALPSRSSCRCGSATTRLLAAGYAPVYPQTDLEDPALRPDMAMAGCECALSGTSSRTVEPHCEYWAGRYGCRV